MLYRLVLLSFVVFVASSTSAKQYEVSMQHSFVNFEVDYMKVSLVKGGFDDFEGSFELDEETNKVTSLSFSIVTKSINTGNKKRDKHLRESDFFSSKKHPLIKFVATKMKYTAGELSEVSGNLEILAVIKPISFQINWKGFMNDAIDKAKKSLYLRAKTVLNRKDFGLNWNKSLDSGGWIVSDDVRVDVIIEATPSDSRLAYSRFLKKNKGIKKDVFKEIGKTPVLSNVVTNHKRKIAPKSKENLSDYSANDSRGLKSYLLLFVGFVIFIVLLIGGGFFKKWASSFLEKFFSERIADLISDGILYTVLLAAAILSAPYMGYGDYFAK